LFSMLNKVRLCVDLNFEKRKEKANEIVGIWLFEFVFSVNLSE
jgi:hypothetical protein